MKTRFVLHGRRGAAAILILILTALLFVAVCFSIDVARIQLAQLELQSAADLASRAGSEALCRQVGDPTNMSVTDAAVRQEINMVASLNRIGHTPVSLDMNSDIQFGTATKTTGNHYDFTPSASGSAIDGFTHSVAVFPSIDSFPVVFGGFVNQSDVGLAQSGITMISERDIVVVLDRSGSMRNNRDAGRVRKGDYPKHLREYHQALNNGDAFEEDSGDWLLTRSQALKLALLFFRNAIDHSRGHEQLGLIAYAAYADNVDTALTASMPAEINSSLPQSLLNQVVSDPPWNYASRLEDESTGYRNFDFNYLSLLSSGNTHIAQGIEKGTDILYGPERRFLATPVLIVMTDGQHNRSGTPAGSAAAVKAAHPELLIYTVTFGSGANQADMQAVASIGGGQHYHANNVLELVDVFEELANTAGVTLIE